MIPTCVQQPLARATPSPRPVTRALWSMLCVDKHGHPQDTAKELASVAPIATPNRPEPRRQETTNDASGQRTKKHLSATELVQTGLAAFTIFVKAPAEKARCPIMCKCHRCLICFGHRRVGATGAGRAGGRDAMLRLGITRRMAITPTAKFPLATRLTEASRPPRPC